MMPRTMPTGPESTVNAPESAPIAPLSSPAPVAAPESAVVIVGMMATMLPTTVSTGPSAARTPMMTSTAVWPPSPEGWTSSRHYGTMT